MSLHEFAGDPKQIGNEYGEAHAARIHNNLSVLVYRDGFSPLPRTDRSFSGWVRDQESRITRNWPWLLEEMAGVAGAVGVDFEDILLLNLRAWQYEYYGAEPALGACSSLAITLDDGTLACAGALDDPIEYYCGPVQMVPSTGYGFITFPLSGTSWASRSMNSRGLSIGISSQVLPGLRHSDNAINQDLAVRVISQTCATVDDVREFCRTYPFTMNIVCVDANGGMFCAHHTVAGLLEIPTANGYCGLTNHIACDEYVEWLRGHGAIEFPESETTRPRLDKLTKFAKERNSKCSAEEVKQFIGMRDDKDAGTINNKSSIYITFANPQADPGKFWIMEPSGSTEKNGFNAYCN